jgi:transposase
VKDAQAQSIRRIEMSDAEIEGLLRKTASALTPEEVNKLRQLVATLKYLTVELEKKNVSVQRLRKMLFGDQSEKTGNLRLRNLLTQGLQAAGKLDEQAKQGDATGAGKTGNEGGSDQPTPGHGRRAAAEYSGAQHTHVPHKDLKHKDRCPKCSKGRLYLQKQPKVLVRLTGSAPIQAKVWTYDWLRCNACGAIFDAELPKEAGPPEKYDESVTATIGLVRYGFGMPFNRLARLQENVHVPLPAGTQWNLINASAPHLEAVFVELIKEAARGEVMHNDDTVARILELMKSRKELPAEDAADPAGKERTGVFTTGIISTVGNKKISLFLTGINHAGENMQAVLAQCEPGARQVIQMSDGLARNEPKHLPEGLAVIQANCLAHGRRKYVEIADDFPERCLHVLEEIEKVYKNEAQTRKGKMSTQERLAYHQEHSKSIMEDLQTWLRAQIEQRLVEPNGGFGEATLYMLKRWDRLTRFLTVAGAPIDNNICERGLKRAIRHRKNSLFYKTLHGARVGDIYMSLIHTCELNQINPFTYLTALVRKGERLSENPAAWLPWNYASQTSQDQVATEAA